MASPTKKRKRTPCFRIEFSGNEEKRDEILDKIQQVKNKLTTKFDKPVGNLQVLETVFENWFDQQGDHEEGRPDPSTIPSTYVKVKKQKVNQHIFLCAEDSMKRCIEVVEHHARQCKENLRIKKILKKGHVVSASMQCEKNKTVIAFYGHHHLIYHLKSTW